jgi:glycogen operon protein
VFRRRRWFQGRPVHGDGQADIAWFRPDGSPMRDEDWRTAFAKSLAVLLNGDAIPTPGPRGEAIHGATFLLLFNAHHEDVAFRLPGQAFGAAWTPVVDTASARFEEGDSEPAASELKVMARSLLVLRRVA